MSDYDEVFTSAVDDFKKLSVGEKNKIIRQNEFFENESRPSGADTDDSDSYRKVSHALSILRAIEVCISNVIYPSSRSHYIVNATFNNK